MRFVDKRHSRMQGQWFFKVGRAGSSFRLGPEKKTLSGVVGPVWPGMTTQVLELVPTGSGGGSLGNE